MNIFYSITSPQAESKLAEWDEGVNLGVTQCPVFPAHRATGPGQRTTALKVVLPKPPLDDFVWTWVNDCLISDRVLRFLRSEGFKGWTVRRASARFGQFPRRSPPRLWELRVHGWAGLAHRDSGVRLKYHCQHCGLTEYTCFVRPEKLVDISKWDGSDFFMVWPLPGFILVTDRVVKALKEEGFKGWRAERLEALSCETGLSPGRLSWYMSANRARKLAESPEMFEPI